MPPFKFLFRTALALLLPLLAAGAHAQDDGGAPATERPSWAATDWLAHDTARKAQEGMRYHGVGDYDSAYKAYIVAARRGYPDAQLAVASYCAAGVIDGIGMDPVEAVKWYLLSGTGIGRHYADLMHEDMTEEQWAEALHRVEDWRPVQE